MTSKAVGNATQLVKLHKKELDALGNKVQNIASTVADMAERMVFVTQMLEESLEPLPTPDELVLSVPYLSQWGTGADTRRGDCGPACIAMLAHYMSAHRPTVDQAATACGQPAAGRGSQYTGHAQLRNGALGFGVKLETRSPYTIKHGKPELTLELLKDQADRGFPSVVLVHYGVLRDEVAKFPDAIRNQDNSFIRGHWFFFVGYKDGHVVVHDPDFWGNKAVLGEFRQIPVYAFVAALEAVAPGCTVGNQGLVVLA